MPFFPYLLYLQAIYGLMAEQRQFKKAPATGSDFGSENHNKQQTFTDTAAYKTAIEARRELQQNLANEKSRIRPLALLYPRKTPQAASDLA